MKIFDMLIFCGLCLFAAHPSYLRAQEDSSQEVLALEVEGVYTQFQQGVKAFSFEALHEKLEQPSTSNQIISPLGITFLMSMIQHGVGVEDQEEIAQILHLPRDERILKMSASRSIQQLTSEGMDIAGLVYLNPQFRLNPNFQQEVSVHYRSKVESGRSAARVNQWVQSVTNGQIKEIVNQGELNDFYVLLSNAIHFKADWRSPFKKKETRVDNFFAPDQVIEKEMMCQMNRMDYYEDELCQAVRMGYKGSGCSMIFVLPKINNDFSFIDEHYFNQIEEGFQSMLVRIELPKFKLEYEFDVKEFLGKMGIAHLFSKPDFSKMVDLSHPPSASVLRKMSITKMKQQCALACDEKGTEASAVTTAVISVTSIGSGAKPYKEIILNRPFLSALMSTEMPILFGVVRKP